MKVDADTLMSAWREGSWIIILAYWPLESALALIEEDRFGFEPEITAKIAKLKCTTYEVGITYCVRSYKEGKKIGWKDGFRAVYAIFKYNLFRRNSS
jgi:hypothetical protein